MKLLSLNVVVAIAAITNVAFAQSGKLLEPSEVLSLINASSTTYTIASADDDAIREEAMARMYPARREPVPMPEVVKDASGLHVQTHKFKGTAEPDVKEGELAYGAKDYVVARAHYLKALAEDPEFYPSLEFIGDTYFGEGRYDSAMVWYDKARDANPLDYQPLFYRADALYHLGRYDEARQSLIDVLVLRPRYAHALQMAHQMSKIAMAVHDSNFAAHSYATKTGAEIQVTLAKSVTTGWSAFALAKAVWLGEAEHRRNLSGDDKLTWSMEHERECLANLLIGYHSGKEKDGEDAQIEQIERVTNDHMLDAFIVYEIASRMYPDITLTQTPAARASVRQYIAKYVLPTSN